METLVISLDDVSYVVRGWYTPPEPRTPTYPGFPAIFEIESVVLDGDPEEHELVNSLDGDTLCALADRAEEAMLNIEPA